MGHSIVAGFYYFAGSRTGPVVSGRSLAGFNDQVGFGTYSSAQAMEGGTDDRLLIVVPGVVNAAVWSGHVSTEVN